MRADVTSEAEMQKAVDLAMSAFGARARPVNAAGVGPSPSGCCRRRARSRSRTSTRLIQINLVGTFNVIRLAAAAMAGTRRTRSGERGVIVNTASVAAFDGQIGQAAYSASKGGIVAHDAADRARIRALGISVMTIAPGIFDTPLLAGCRKRRADRSASRSRSPHVWAGPSEYAALVRHIFENEMLNGEVIRLDGAIRMAPK